MFAAQAQAFAMHRILRAGNGAQAKFDDCGPGASRLPRTLAIPHGATR